MYIFLLKNCVKYIHINICWHIFMHISHVASHLMNCLFWVPSHVAQPVLSDEQLRETQQFFFPSSFLGNTYSWVEWGKLSIYHIKYMSPLPGPEWHTSSSSLASCSTLMAARCATASSLCSLPRGLSVQRVFIGDSLSQQPCWSVKQVHFTGIHGQSIQTPATVKSEEVPGCYE